MQIQKYLPLTLLALLTACGPTIDRLQQVGKAPALAGIEDPRAKNNYVPVSLPTPEPEVSGARHPGSLWQPGARAFFKDQRASRVGDILKVNIQIKDKAALDNQTQRTRDTKDSMGAPQVFGAQGQIGRYLPGDADPESLIDITGKTDNKGSGTIDRKEEVTTSIAALVTQILPNGNLVISGRQEIRINFEVREVSIDGVVRPEDISSDNTVDSTQIAEARISYGGRGQLTDVQQPRYGSQILDVLSPF